MLKGSEQQQNIALAKQVITALRNPQSIEGIKVILPTLIAILEDMHNFENIIKELHRQLKTAYKHEDTDGIQRLEMAIEDFEKKNPQNGLQIKFNQCVLKHNLTMLSNIRAYAKVATSNQDLFGTTERLYQIFGLLNVYATKLKEFLNVDYSSKFLMNALQPLIEQNFSIEAIETFLKENEAQYKNPSDENDRLVSNIIQLKDEIRLLTQRLSNYRRALEDFDIPFGEENEIIKKIKATHSLEEILQKINEIESLIAHRAGEIPEEINILQNKIKENEARIKEWGSDRVFIADYFTNILTLVRDIEVLFNADVMDTIPTLEEVLTSIDSKGLLTSSQSEKEDWSDLEIGSDDDVFSDNNKKTASDLKQSMEDDEEDWAKECRTQKFKPLKLFFSQQENSAKKIVAEKSEDSEEEDWTKECNTEAFTPFKLGSPNIKAKKITPNKSSQMKMEDSKSDSEEEDWSTELGITGAFATLQLQPQKNSGLTPSFEASKRKVQIEDDSPKANVTEDNGTDNSTQPVKRTLPSLTNYSSFS